MNWSGCHEALLGDTGFSLLFGFFDLLSRMRIDVQTVARATTAITSDTEGEDAQREYGGHQGLHALKQFYSALFQTASVARCGNYRNLQFGDPTMPFRNRLMALWSYGRQGLAKNCNEPEYAVVSNSRTFV